MAHLCPLTHRGANLYQFKKMKQETKDNIKAAILLVTAISLIIGFITWIIWMFISSGHRSYQEAELYKSLRKAIELYIKNKLT